jgi:rhodanese-related sulfurtransferase
MGCKSPGTSSGVTQISVQALRDSLTANPDLLLVDVRTPAEWEARRLLAVKKFIEHDQIASRVAEMGGDTSTAVYLICRSGNRSALAAETLAGLGHRHLFNVEGGMNAWVNAGFPVDSGPLADDRR